MTQAYALYRLPGEREYTEVRQLGGGVQKETTFEALSVHQGFVIAPFSISEECPLLIINPEVCVRHSVPECNVSNCYKGDFSKDKESYISNFNDFHTRLLDGTFRKIVLSRKSEVTRYGEYSDEEIFFKACRMYPDQFVALVSTPYSGTWLMATPEILLEGDGSLWHTMALAGTMRNEPDATWNDKNKREQKYVGDYIGNILKQFTDSVSVKGPYTVRAGGLVHLRSDFSFSLKSSSDIGKLIDMLHPTPAVCGLPKKEALSYILSSEHSERLYYSGFTGILDTKGNTHLFVSLRCMKMTQNRYSLYAGGGLLDASTAEKEWLETEAKMETMKKCLI